MSDTGSINEYNVGLGNHLLGNSCQLYVICIFVILVISHFEAGF